MTGQFAVAGSWNVATSGKGAALRVVFLYAVFGFLWITLSDRLLLTLIHDPGTLTIAQTYKGWLFIGASTLLLYALLLRELHRREWIEAAQRESEARYRRLVETADEGIWVGDADGHMSYVNERLAQMLGYRVEELRGRPLLDFVHPEDREGAEGCFATVRQGGARQHELRLCRKDGGTVWVLASCNPILDERGEFLGALNMLTDITARKRAVQELAAADERLLAGEREKKQFLQEILRAVTQDKLHLVEPEAVPTVGQVVLELALDDPDSYGALRKKLREIAVGAGMAPEVAEDFVLAVGEAATNAVKHATQGRCSVYLDEDRVLMRVSDRGSGIKPEALPRSVLQPGFSTKVSLGMGYTLMLHLADCIWLATGAAGTIVQLAKWTHPEEHPEPCLAAALERF